MEPYYIKISNWMQRFAIKNKAMIIRIFLLVELGLILLMLSGVVMASLVPSYLLTYYMVGKKLGTTAAVLLSLVVLPGIFKRLRWFQSIRITMMLFRRHLGILMYWTAITHGFFIFWLPWIAFGPSPVDLFTAFGLLATTLSLPLLITSNEFSVRLLKRWWSVLHKLVYVVLLFAALHTLKKSFSTGLFLLGLVILEGISYYYAFITRDSARR